MTRGWRLVLGVVSMIALGARSLGGCAAGDERPKDDEEIDSGSRDADPTDGEGDASASDGSVDAALDGDAKPKCSADGWCRTVLPTEELIEAGVLDPDMPALDVRDVWVFPDRTAWAVTITGHVLEWTNGAWRIAFDAGSPLLSIWGVGDGELWIGGERGVLLHGTKSGSKTTFEAVPFDDATVVLRVWGTSSTDVWAITPRSVFRYRGRSSGSSPVFEQVDMPEPIPGRVRIHGDVWATNGDLWIGGMENVDCPDGQCGGSFRSTIVLLRWRGDGDPSDGGSPSWDRIEVHAPELNPSTSAILVAGTGATDGTQLAHVVQNNFAGVVRVAPANAGTLDASIAVDAGDYVRSLERAITYGRPERLWASTSDDVWMVGSPGLVRHWDGTTWNLVRVSVDNKLLLKELHAIAATTTSSGEREMWIVGRDIAMVRSEAP